MRSKNCQAFLWWVGVPAALLLIIWGPYWIWNIVTGQPSWFRIPMVAGTIFDVTAYLQSVGHAMHGLSGAGLLGPFAWPIRALSRIFPQASVAEIWFITRWMSECAAIWVGAWAIRNFSGSDPGRARLVSLALWLSLVIVLGMRPAVFSWFLPLGMFGMGAVMRMDHHLRKREAGKALAWFVLGLALSSVYAWYFLFVAVWGAVVWFQWFIQSSPRIAFVFAILVTIAASFCAVILSFWVTQNSEGIIWLELYQRLSLSYTHFPFVSSSLLLTILWGILLVPLLRTIPEPWYARLGLAFIGWISLVFCFLLSPFTGHFILNDHFRAPAVVLSWFTLALIWEVYVHRPSPPPLVYGWMTRLPFVVFVGASLYVFRILAAPYAWNRDFLNVVQLSHWFALFVASLLVLALNHSVRRIGSKTFFLFLFGCLFCLSGIALSAVYNYEFAGLKRLEPLLPVFRWINVHIPVDATLCADHGGEGYSLDDMLSAHTGRVVYVAHTTLYHHERDQAYLDRMRTIAGFYDVRAAGDEDYWKLQSSLNQFIVCGNFPLQKKIFQAFGWSEARINHLIGCPQSTIESRWSYVKERIDHPVSNTDAFKKICPWVAIPKRSRNVWQLPADYHEQTITNDFSLFSFRIPPSNSRAP